MADKVKGDGWEDDMADLDNDAISFASESPEGILKNTYS